jgi:hypothetical protein
MSDKFRRGRSEEAEVDYKEQLISAIEYLRTERKENKSLQEELKKMEESQNSNTKEVEQMIMMLKGQLEEAIRIEETLEDQKQYLEAKITTQKEEAEKREKILTDHLKERTNDLNHLEAEFSQQERKLEDEIITLKIQLEEAK